jgi:hypothetical protein
MSPPVRHQTFNDFQSLHKGSILVRFALSALPSLPNLPTAGTFNRRKRPQLTGGTVCAEEVSRIF